MEVLKAQKRKLHQQKAKAERAAMMERHKRIGSIVESVFGTLTDGQMDILKGLLKTFQEEFSTELHKEIPQPHSEEPMTEDPEELDPVFK